MREFIRGAGLLFRGFAHWRRRPGAMALGLIPAAIVAVLFAAGLVALGLLLPGLTSTLTPFADGWSPVWATIIRVTLGTAVFGAALAIGAVSFTALTLLIGEPFYDRIWRSVEAAEGEGPLEADYGFWRAARDSLTLIARGILIALIAVLIGLVPVVGSILSGAVGVTLTGWLLADELTSRALTARGLLGPQRRAVRRGQRARVLGFGVATQLCFLVPLGAVATMPAAVAGSTLLARSLLAEAADAP
ncbi:EI24 domain-containing protein [Microbacterium sp. R86528]|uniref:EI24 domain-containing protein n=1 Tax=Microbacterium sp. R86528 TaxID=3093864 RepID=UPI0037CC9067